MLLDYVNGFTSLVYVPAIAFGLLGVTPFDTTGWSYATHMIPLAVATEAWLLVINRPFADRRSKQRHPYRALWRARVIWTGMAPIYMRAAVQALAAGPNRRPVYRVTRKHDDHRWHWQLTVPQAFAVTATAAVGAYSTVHHTLPPLAVLLATTYWGGLHLILFTRFITFSWHGVRRRRRAATSWPAPAPVPAT
jgi:cellulose synthase (UDP-forming)